MGYYRRNKEEGKQRLRANSNDIEFIMKWFNDEIEKGDNSILIYPNLQTFRQIYMQYVKDQLAKEEDNRINEKLKPGIIILIATFYDTINSVKHNLRAVGVDVQRHIDNGSLVIVDAFSSYFPDINGMKKLVASLSQRARKEGRVGVSAIVNMGYFFLYGGDGRATELINYEASLPPKTDGGNVIGFNCYHLRDYNTLKDSQKEELVQGQKKLLKVTEALLEAY
jgi:hypothetical protein